MLQQNATRAVKIKNPLRLPRNRSEEVGREWDGSKKSYVPKQTVEVFDGKGRNLLFISDRFDQPHADFHIRSGDLFGKDLRSSPLRMALCPFRAGVGEFRLQT